MNNNRKLIKSFLKEWLENYNYAIKNNRYEFIDSDCCFHIKYSNGECITISMDWYNGEKVNLQHIENISYINANNHMDYNYNDIMDYESKELYDELNYDYDKNSLFLCESLDEYYKTAF